MKLGAGYWVLDGRTVSLDIGHCILDIEYLVLGIGRISLYFQ